MDMGWPRLRRQTICDGKSQFWFGDNIHKKTMHGSKGIQTKKNKINIFGLHTFVSSTGLYTDWAKFTVIYLSDFPSCAVAEASDVVTIGKSSSQCVRNLTQASLRGLVLNYLTKTGIPIENRHRLIWDILYPYPARTARDTPR